MQEIIRSLAGVTITIHPANPNRSLYQLDYRYTLEGTDFKYSASDIEADSFSEAVAELLNRLDRTWEGFPRSVNRWAMKHHEEIYWQARAMEEYLDRQNYISATKE